MKIALHPSINMLFARIVLDGEIWYTLFLLFYSLLFFRFFVFLYHLSFVSSLPPDVNFSSCLFIFLLQVWARSVSRVSDSHTINCRENELGFVQVLPFVSLSFFLNFSLFYFISFHFISFYFIHFVCYNSN